MNKKPSVCQVCEKNKIYYVDLSTCQGCGEKLKDWGMSLEDYLRIMQQEFPS